MFELRNLDVVTQTNEGEDSLYVVSEPVTCHLHNLNPPNLRRRLWLTPYSHSLPIRRTAYGFFRITKTEYEYVNTRI